MAALASKGGRRPPDQRRACPACGPQRQSPVNKTRKVLGVWYDEKGRATTWCIRCQSKPDAGGGDAGPMRGPVRPQPDRAAIAAWLWSKSLPITGTPGERYFRDGRGISCPLPATVRYLPGSGMHSHAVISAFGQTCEIAPGEMELPRSVTAVHFTALGADGRECCEKRMTGPVSGQPIVLAPPNDGLGLVICEGIEDGLSTHEATGLGVWAAGSAIHLPKLAAAVPAYIEAITILADADEAGLSNSLALRDRLVARGLAADISRLGKV